MKRLIIDQAFQNRRKFTSTSKVQGHMQKLNLGQEKSPLSKQQIPKFILLSVACIPEYFQSAVNKLI